MIRNYILATLIGLTVTLWTTQARAGGDEVVVIYNSAMPESKAMADYYAKKRDVPASQVWGFDMNGLEAISRAEFRTTIQQPILHKLESSKLWTFGRATVVDTNGVSKQQDDMLLSSGVRYAVLCYGVPLKILPDPSLGISGAESLRPELRRNEAAVDTELALLPWIYQRFTLAGPLRNPLYGSTNSASFQPTNGVLMVTRLDGPSPEIARGLVDKAIEAETYGLWGRAYFDLRNVSDPNYKLGDEFIRGAAEVCRHLGFETIVDENPETFPVSFPMSQIAFYCGWYDLNASGPFSLKEVEFMPGAFAYHLHSYSANTLRSRDGNWVGPLLDRGATITMGCVAEPYLSGTPDVAVFASRFILYGMSFGEAAYSSQSVLSWQTTIVGDPLYRPFAKSPQKIHLELEAANNKLIEWSHLKVVNLNIANGHPAGQMLGYLEQVPTTKQSAVLSEKFGDLCVKLGKPSSAIFAYEQALALDPTRQQRVRLRLVLGEKLLESGKNEEAYENYRKLIEDEWPQYPGRLDVCQKLLPLAKKLGKTADVIKWQDSIKLLSPPPAQPSTNVPATKP